MLNSNIQSEVAEYIDSMVDDFGDWYVGKYRLIAHHNGEMLGCSATNVPNGSKLDIVLCADDVSGKVIATFDLEYLTLKQLTSFLDAA